MKFCDKKGLPCFYVVGDESLESYTAGISFLFALARRTKTIVVLACPDGIPAVSECVAAYDDFAKRLGVPVVFCRGEDRS